MISETPYDMIRFRRDEAKVILNVEHGVFYGNEFFSLEIPQSYEYQAELLRKAFQDNLDRHLKAIKEEAYKAGWKDAKAKTKKRTEFYGGWKFF